MHQAVVQQGDLVQFSDDDNNLVRAIVQYATEQEGAYKSRIYLDTAKLQVQLLMLVL